jgi:hypothetical protein
MDPAEDDGTGNPQKADRLLERPRNKRKRRILFMGGHKNYRFNDHHRAQVLIKPAFLVCVKMKKLVFVTAPIS